MRRFALSVLGCLLAASVMAQSQLTLLGAGPGQAGCAAYTGPGDVVASATAWWGLRGYSAAYSTGSNPAADIIRASDSTSTTINITSCGDLNVAAVTSFCASTTCKFTQLYDQTGNGHHLTQGTDANRPTLTANCIKTTYPCLGLVRASALRMFSDNFPNLSTTYAFVGLAMRTGSVTSASPILDYNGSNPYLLYNGTNTVCWAASGVCLNDTSTGTPSVWHAVTASVTTNSRTLVVDTTVTTNTTSGSALNGAPVWIGCKGAGAECLDGNQVEAGVWPAVITGASATSMNSNIKTYWGY